MNPPVLNSIIKFLDNPELRTLELEFSVLTTTISNANFQMKNLPSRRSFWKIFMVKNYIGNVTFYFRDGPKYVFSLVVDDDNMPLKESENFIIKEFIVFGADPIAGTKMKISNDVFQVNANLTRTGNRLTQLYQNCLSITSHREKLDFQTLTKNPEGNDNCYIATLVYNDINHPQVQKLRNYRDEVLIKSFFGKIFISIYYFSAPKLIFLLKPFPSLQRKIRVLLNNFINNLSK